MGETASTVVRQGIAGAIGGIIAFLLLAPASLTTEAPAMHRAIAGDADILTGLRTMAFFGAGIGACIAATLALADELGSGRLARIGGRAALALAAGAVVGGGAGLVAQVLFQFLLESGAL